MTETDEHAQEIAGRDGASVRIPPPLVPLSGLGLGLLLEWQLGPLGYAPSGGLRFGAGALLTLLGLGLIMAAGNLFRRTGQDPKPWKSTPEIIATGVYRFTRNPMYLGMGLAQAGLGLVFGTLWSAALVPVSWWIIYWIAVRHEEAYLARKFGAAYLDYKASVRRWL